MNTGNFLFTLRLQIFYRAPEKAWALYQSLLQDPPQNKKLIASAGLCAQPLPTFLPCKGCGVLVLLSQLVFRMWC